MLWGEAVNTNSPHWGGLTARFWGGVAWGRGDFLNRLQVLLIVTLILLVALIRIATLILLEILILIRTVISIGISQARLRSIAILITIRKLRPKTTILISV